MSDRPTDRQRAEAWLADHGIRTVRLQMLALDAPDLAKYLSVPKFLSSIEKGAALVDTIYNVDLGGSYGLGWDLGAWRGEVADLIVRPDVTTLVDDPHMDGLASVMADFILPDGSPNPLCGRTLLRREVERLAALGYSTIASVELEANLFEGSLDELKVGGFSSVVPLGRSLQRMYHPEPTPRMPAYMDAVTRRLDALGIAWEAWNDEAGSGQVELNLAPTDPVTAADRIVRAKIAMREIAAEHGITVSFMAKWHEHEAGNGFHINHSIWKEGRNLFHEDDRFTAHWMGGLMATLLPASSIFQPTVNAYRRLAETAAGTRALWGVDNKTGAIRFIPGGPKAARIEHRVPSSDVNIYLATAAVLAGGRLGVEQEIEPPPPFQGMAWGLPPGYPMMPESLPEAVEALREDRLLREALGAEFVEYWIGTRRWEWFNFHTGGGDPDAITPWELERYIPVV